MRKTLCHLMFALWSVGPLVLTLPLLLIGCPTQTPPPPPGPTPPPIPTLGALELCADKKHFCYQGVQVFLRGYSNYVGFIQRYDYEAWAAQLEQSGVNLAREWTAPVPNTWLTPGGTDQQPYLFQNGEASLNKPYWENADAFIEAGGRHGVWFMVDVLDHYGLTRGGQKPPFSTNPLSSALGGPLVQGVPDVYDLYADGSSPVLRMIELGARRLSRHKNVFYQVMNEPGGSRDEHQLTAFHSAVVQAIRRAHSGALVGINPVPDKDGRPLSPKARDVGADFVTIHGAGVDEPSDPRSCTAEAVASALKAIERWQGVAVINDTDGFYSARFPCNRDDNAVLGQVLRGSRGSAGFNHKDYEPSRGMTPDLEALKTIRVAAQPVP